MHAKPIVADSDADLLAAAGAVANKGTMVMIDVYAAIRSAAVELHAEKPPPVAGLVLVYSIAGMSRWFARSVKRFAGHRVDE